MFAPHENTYYTHTANQIAPFGQLDGDIEADVCIIGGGFTGVASAIELAERGLSVVLLEANRIGWGATGRNGGQITGSLSGDTAMEREFTKTLGANNAKALVWRLRWRGHEIIKSRVEKYQIACDLKPGHLHAAWNDAHLKDLAKFYEQACAHDMEHEVELLDHHSVQSAVGTDIYVGGILNWRNMHVHSLNLCLGEADAARSLGARIFEGTEVTAIEYGVRPRAVTKTGSVKARKILLAGNAYHRLGGRKLHGLLFPATLGVVATEPLPEELARKINPMDIGVYDTRFVLDYYRLTADRRLLFGGGTNYSGSDIANVEQKLRPAIERTFPDLKGIGIDFAWQGTAGITINRIPQLGQITDNVFFAQGYSGHGIATSHIIGEVMAEALTTGSQEFHAFAYARQWRVPLGCTIGNQLLSLGMWFYQLRDART